MQSSCIRYIVILFILLTASGCNKVQVTNVDMNDISNKSYNNEVPYKSIDWKSIKSEDIYFGNTPSNHANGGMICEKDGWIYYSDINNDGYLCKARINGSEKSVLFKEKCFNINIIDNIIYFQSREDNFIKKCNMDGQNIDTLIDQLVHDIIVTSEYIYFSADYIEKIDLDGSNRTKLTSKGEYLYLDLYGDYIFFTMEHDDFSLYAIKTGSNDIYSVKINSKGSVIIGDNLFYTDVDNNLNRFDINLEENSILDQGYNATIKDNQIFYIKNDYIIRYLDNNNVSCIFPDIDDKNNYIIDFYYIIGNKLFIIYCTEISQDRVPKFISLDIETGEINLV